MLCQWFLFNMYTYVAMKEWQSQVAENFILGESILNTVVCRQPGDFCTHRK